MGYMRHHCIIITGWDKKIVNKAYRKATSIFTGCPISKPTKEVINGYTSFWIAPDGSKEGWGDSDKGDMERGEFIKYLMGLYYEDGSSPLAWALVQYGDDNCITKIIDSNDDNR